jgi:Ca2+-binding RTX toxin-like protein
MARIRINGTNGNNSLFAPNPLYDTYEIYGLGGDDTLGGGTGGDLLDGGQGFDFASYERASGPVRVDMLDMASNTGWAAGDRFYSIEGLIGSRYDDWLAGDDNNNIIDGYGGNDVIFGNGGDDVVRDAGGNDRLHGGTDNFVPAAPIDPHPLGDVLEYAGRADKKLGITADLEAGYVIEHSFDSRDGIEGFEGIRGTAYNDTIYGSEDHDSILAGREGSDTIYGRGGNDAISGGDGGDHLFGDDGSDFISGGDGGDEIAGGLHDDDLRGGNGIDTVSYADVDRGFGVHVQLADEMAEFSDSSYVFERDSVIGFENVIGTRYRDFINGSAEANVLEGRDGDDFLYGYGGDDTLIGGDGDDVLAGNEGADHFDGGEGSDWADCGLLGVAYPDPNQSIVISLANPEMNTLWAAGDTYASIENIRGSLVNDTIYGNDGDNIIVDPHGSNVLYGNGGNDTLAGSRDAADWFYGGTGEDTVDYSSEHSPSDDFVTVDLLHTALNAGDAAGDRFSSIENIVGTEGDDTISGNSANNEFRGGEGNDRFMGRYGTDALWGDGGSDTAVFRGDVDDYEFRVLHFNADMGYERFLEVRDLTANRDGTDYVIGIEQLEFNGVVHNISEWII